MLCILNRYGPAFVAQQVLNLLEVECPGKGKKKVTKAL